jgi:hypothetical protein
MRVSEIAVNDRGAEFCQLQARVESDAAPDDESWFAPFTLWHRYPPWSRPLLNADNGDPFLAALLLPAMCSGERLTLPIPVSPHLLEALPEIQAIYTAFEPRATPIAIEASARDEPLPDVDVQPAVGLFFSLGVDSFYSLLKNQRDHPADSRTITHLISVHGFDVPYPEWEPSFPPQMLANLHRVATETGTTLMPVITNLRHVAARLAPWYMLHGAALASIALALGRGFRRVSIAATTRYDKLFPWGSHPLLDPLWSTERLAFVHDGCEMDKADKTRVVATSPLAMATLRPCAGYGQGYNCGRCLKCLRTFNHTQMQETVFAM